MENRQMAAARGLLGAARMKRSTQIAPLGFVFWLVAGCGSSGADDLEGGHGGGGSGSAGTPPGGSDIGATPGGAQDIGYARDLIAGGEVPGGDALTVEGLLSEHDIPTTGPACDSLICLRPALGRAPALSTGDNEYWIQIGLTSGIEDFERPPLDLVVAIDKSQPMSIDMDETNEAVTRLIDQLGPDDRLAVIAFDTEVHTIHEFGAVRDKDAVQADVRAIRADGGFNINKGTEAAYDILYDNTEEDPDRLRRVVLLSCGYPSIDSDFDDPYSERVLRAGEDGIGMTFYGVLLGYSGQLADLLGEAWGGSYGYIESLDKVEQIFDEDFDLMMTPLAYDLQFEMEIGDRFELAEVYGIPGDGADGAEQGFDVATVFPSRGDGAMAARLRPAAPEETDKLVSDVSLSYLPETAVGGEGVHDQTERVTRPENVGDDESHYQSDGVRKLVALVNMAESMKAVGEAYHDGEIEEAEGLVLELLEYLETEAESLDDDDIEEEVDLIEALADNIAEDSIEAE